MAAHSSPRSLMPREHGAYGQLALPLLTALFSGRPTAAAFLYAAAAVFAFFAHEPLLVLLGQRGSRAFRELGARARLRLTLLAVGTLLCAGLALMLSSQTARLGVCRTARRGAGALASHLSQRGANGLGRDRRGVCAVRCRAPGCRRRRRSGATRSLRLGHFFAGLWTRHAVIAPSDLRSKADLALYACPGRDSVALAFRLLARYTNLRSGRGRRGTGGRDGLHTLDFPAVAEAAAPNRLAARAQHHGNWPVARAGCAWLMN